MAHRVSPLWWPVLAAGAPVLAPWLGLRYRRFRAQARRAEARNRGRLARAAPLVLSAVERLSLTVLVDWRAEPGFRGDAAVSYLLRTDQGAVLFDLGYGPATPVFDHNAERLGFDPAEVDALVISHLHLDHMGGLAAQRARQVVRPASFTPPAPIPCFLPDRATAPGLSAEVVAGPRLIAAGIATTGPLARSLFFFGLMEEQALVLHLADRGLVVVTGCGHPTVPAILELVRRLSDAPLYAVIGGLHFPVTAGRSVHAGIQLPMLFGTGKPPWRAIKDADLSETIGVLNAAGARRVLLSAHDTCDHALARLAAELDADTDVLHAGGIYQL